MSFSQSVSNISFNRGVLQADCRRKDGTTKRSRINLDQFIANDNGILVVRPDGRFSQTCTDITISDGILHCLAQQSNSKFCSASQLDLNSFVKNNDGNLEWSQSSVESCKFYINNGILHSESRMAAGPMKKASLALDDWIGNNDGQLVIRRNGNFSRSCSDITLEDGVLRCMASRQNGDDVPSEMDLKQFIKIENGDIMWIPDISSWAIEDNKNANTGSSHVSNSTYSTKSTNSDATNSTGFFARRCEPANPQHTSAFCAPSTSIR
jgi:hypothetical protein